ncbi:hypothetical protein [Azospirillum thiophilum]|uniref:hypothetical protein n=1 Tax=Azospirillum thiophilum TaxID=528244 RepID=UPI00118766FF|nr:hypothetical protein [Azospirillum thiophilum]
MTAPLWITGPPTPAIGGRYGGPVPHSSYTTPWGTTHAILRGIVDAAMKDDRQACRFAGHRGRGG